MFVEVCAWSYNSILEWNSWCLDLVLYLKFRIQVLVSGLNPSLMVWFPKPCKLQPVI